MSCYHSSNKKNCSSSLSNKHSEWYTTINVMYMSNVAMLQWRKCLSLSYEDKMAKAFSPLKETAAQ